MGASLSWIAVNSPAEDVILEKLRLLDGSEPVNIERVPDWEFGIGQYRDWRIVVSADPDWAGEARLLELGTNAPVLMGRYTDQTDMLAHIMGAENGEVIWEVRYEAAEGDVLFVSGALPPDVLTTVEAVPPDTGEDEDYYLVLLEAVLKIWTDLVGFQPEERTDVVFTLAKWAGRAPVEALVKEPGKRGFWARVFGSR